ncbi:MAG TPA: serine protease [Thermoplasmata archaeon]|nr:serine protease [Thermoplasmata archaeon]
MFAQGVLNTIRSGVCAVGYLTVNAKEYSRDPTRPFLKVVGTGFLVRETTVITNRHVIEGLHSAQTDLGFPDDQKLLLFVFPAGAGEWHTAFCFANQTSISEDPRVDVGFIELSRRPEPQFEQCKPLSARGFMTLSVGQPIAAWGYAYGTEMLTKDGRTYRFGPVLQQGHVSALSPFDKAGVIDEVLLDLRGAPGMSGSPVFQHDGNVVGMIYATWEATTAVAVPLDGTNLGVWLEAHDKVIESSQ